MGYQDSMLAQILRLITKDGIEGAINKYLGDKWVKKFNTKNHLTVMLYGQITGKDSLRDIVRGLKVHKNKLYHLGIKGFSKSSLSEANKKRDWRIFREIFYIIKERKEMMSGKHGFRFNNKLYLLDTTFIELAISLFPWAVYRKRKGGIKLHTLIDVDGLLPEVVVVSEARSHDLAYVEEVTRDIIRDSIIVFDRGYVDYRWFGELEKRGLYFVTRAKKRMEYVVSGQLKVSKRAKDKGVIEDNVIEFIDDRNIKHYPYEMRMVVYKDPESGKKFEFITNNFVLSPLTIAKLYKKRWDIELFFKWIKQNLKIKSFLGTSKNAVLIQIWTALIYYLILSYIRFQGRYPKSLTFFAKIIPEILFSNTDFIDILQIDDNEGINLIKKKINSPPLLFSRNT